MWPAVSCAKERASFVSFAEARASSSHFRPPRAEDVQYAGLASTSSASGHPNAPVVRGSQPGEDCWKTCPLQQHDGPGVVKQDFDRPYNKTDLFPLLDMY